MRRSGPHVVACAMLLFAAFASSRVGSDDSAAIAAVGAILLLIRIYERWMEDNL